MADNTKHTAGAFDIRSFIAALMGIYGVVLFLTGIFGGDKTTSGARVDGNPNLYVGIALIVFAALMQAWAMWRPTVVDEEALEADKHETDGPPPAH
jgi:arginine exporter protein ArgO